MTTRWGMLGRLRTPRVNRAKPSPYAQNQPSILQAMMCLTWAEPKLLGCRVELSNPMFEFDVLNRGNCLDTKSLTSRQSDKQGPLPAREELLQARRGREKKCLGGNRDCGKKQLSFLVIA